MRENENRLNKKTLSLLLAIVLIVTTIGTDVFFVRAESAGETPVVTVGETDETAPVVEVAEESIPETVALEEAAAEEEPQIVSTLDGELPVGAGGENVTTKTEQLDISVVTMKHGAATPDTDINFSGNTIDLSDIEVSDQFKMEIKFRLKKGVGSIGEAGYTPISERTICGGDFFEIQLPDGFIVDSNKGPID